MGNLHICDGTIIAKGFWNNICRQVDVVIFRGGAAYFTKTMTNTFCTYANSKRSAGAKLLNLSAVQICHMLKMFGTLWNENMTKETELLSIKQEEENKVSSVSVVRRRGVAKLCNKKVQYSRATVDTQILHEDQNNFACLCFLLQVWCCWRWGSPFL